MKFEMDSLEVTVKKITTQKANKGSAIYSAISIGIDSIPKSAVCAILGCRSVGELEQAFFRGEKLRFNKIDTLPSHREYQGKHMAQFEGMEEMRVTRLYNIVLHPLSAGQAFGATFSFQIEASSGEQLWLLHELEHGKATMRLIQDAPELLDTLEEEALAEELKAKEREEKAAVKQQPPPKSTQVDGPSQSAH